MSFLTTIVALDRLWTISHKVVDVTAATTFAFDNRLRTLGCSMSFFATIATLHRLWAIRDIMTGDTTAATLVVCTSTACYAG
jgi:hypothetical protein